MKRFLLVLIGVAAVVAFMALPASAADLKFGGMFWTKYYSDDNIKDGTDDADDNLSGFYTRMRLYFTATASENLMAVFKGEIDDIWGDGRIGRVSTDGGSGGRADGSAAVGSTSPTRFTDASANSGMELKNFYIQFNMPNTPLTFLVGALPAKIGSGLVFNDDTNGIVAMGKFDPVKVVLVYSRLQDNAQPTTQDLTGVTNAMQNVTPATPLTSHDDWDLWAGEVRFRLMKELELTLGGSWVNTTFDNPSRDFDLYNAVLDVDFNTDTFSLYGTGGMNFGTVDLAPSGDADFKGYLISAGAAFNLGPVGIGVDGFYSSGSNDTDDINTYVTPGIDGRNTYYMDEVVFPGMFDDESSTISTFPNNGTKLNNVSSTGLTVTNAGYTLTNVWAVGAHVDFKPLEQTLLQAGAAYINFVRDVPSDPDGGEDDKLGTSLYLRLTQGIVDGLQLKAAFGYLIADDGYSVVDNEDDAYKFATGLFWSW